MRDNVLFDLVQRFMASMILVFLTILVEFFLMLGLILCVAYCSGYITLAPIGLDQGNSIVFRNFLQMFFHRISDITSSLLATLTAAISILFYTGTLHLLGKSIS
jgi:hypothetical protein